MSDPSEISTADQQLLVVAQESISASESRRRLAERLLFGPLLMAAVALMVILTFLGALMLWGPLNWGDSSYPLTVAQFRSAFDGDALMLLVWRWLIVLAMALWAVFGRDMLGRSDAQTWQSQRMHMMAVACIFGFIGLAPGWNGGILGMVLQLFLVDLAVRVGGEVAQRGRKS